MVGLSFSRKQNKHQQNKGLMLLLFCLLFALNGALTSPSAKAQSIANLETRSLKIYFVQTKEHDEVVFKRNGRYVPSGLKKLNYLLRDWRRNEAKNMDPRLFDVVWQIYQLSGSKSYIHVASGYRSPRTNTMLRLSSPRIAVAQNSRHTTGQAMDFYLPDVNIAYLRAIALKLQGGGIGYYPGANTPFVHVDVGTVRHWPRMSRPALAALFPQGQTMHVPTDGKPLLGYTQAANDYRARGQTAITASSTQALFGKMSRRQVILAAADGHLPARIGHNYMDDVTEDAPLMASAEIPVPTFPDMVANSDTTNPQFSQIPLPVAAPGTDMDDDELYDVIESNNWVPPVPQPKFDDSKNTDSDELMAYAPQPRVASNGATDALQSLAEVNVVPHHKPQLLGDNAAIKEDSTTNDYQELDARGQALAGLTVPYPHMKPEAEKQDVEELAFRSAKDNDVIGDLIANTPAVVSSSNVPLPAKKVAMKD